MSGYTKLFARILDSTVWRESDPTRLLWITMLALADKEGNVYCTIPGLADRARITLIECEKALEKFQQPDKYSWSQEHEGRRIEPITGGWFLINHAKFRKMMSREETREKTRVRVSKWRAGKKESESVTVTKSNASNDIASTEATTKAKPNTYTGGEVPYSSEKISPPPQKFTQQDFDERDLRKLGEAQTELLKKLGAQVGYAEQMTEDQFFEASCEMAGITVQRGLKLREIQKAWPK